MQQQELFSKRYQLRNAVCVCVNITAWIWIHNAMSLTNSIPQELLKLDFAFPVLSTLQVETIQTWKASLKTLQVKYILNALIINACVSESMYSTCSGCLATDDIEQTLKKKVLGLIEV
jgi:hypothetical protein